MSAQTHHSLSDPQLRYLGTCVGKELVAGKTRKHDASEPPVSLPSTPFLVMGVLHLELLPLPGAAWLPATSVLIGENGSGSLRVAEVRGQRRSGG